MYSLKFVLIEFAGLLLLGIWRVLSAYKMGWREGFHRGSNWERSRNNMRKSGIPEAVIEEMFPNVKR